MNIFESINNTSNKAADIGERYFDKSQEYYKLRIFQQVSYTVSMVGKALIIGAVLFIGLIFLAVAAAIAIGDLLGHVAWGYLIVAAVFFIVAFIIYQVRHLIDGAIIKKFQTKIFK
ncbi:phage holin family protein [Gelidibacter salicanalis]|uniref:Phage holin family protein n=1 Tax=Gelidibacter salicanalis TaxID=291193 RepID=A0A934KJY2_9FLAO|nr:phage holin family protein [Gelidibacter salicanalis]MBJ7880836.1 phage holin family protein [Gelidibacter salicanalis]